MRGVPDVDDLQSGITNDVGVAVYHGYVARGGEDALVERTDDGFTLETSSNTFERTSIGTSQVYTITQVSGQAQPSAGVDVTI